MTLDEGIEVLRRILEDTELHARVDKPEPDADPAQIEYKAKAFFVGMTHVRELINERIGENDWDFHETNH